MINIHKLLLMTNTYCQTLTKTVTYIYEIHKRMSIQ